MHITSKCQAISQLLFRSLSKNMFTFKHERAWGNYDFEQKKSNSRNYVISQVIIYLLYKMMTVLFFFCFIIS